jgi:hypothetical protein
MLLSFVFAQAAVGVIAANVLVIPPQTGGART